MQFCCCAVTSAVEKTKRTARNRFRSTMAPQFNYHRSYNNLAAQKNKNDEGTVCVPAPAFGVTNDGQRTPPMGKKPKPILRIYPLPTRRISSPAEPSDRRLPLNVLPKRYENDNKATRVSLLILKYSVAAGKKVFPFIHWV